MSPGNKCPVDRACLLVVTGFALCSVVLSLTVPVFEAPDEPSHVAVARYIFTNRALPVQGPASPVGQEAGQPPLYYVLGAFLFALAPEPRLAPVWNANYNPHVSFDRAGPGADNRNLFAHPNEGFPYRGDVLGIHLMRLLSVGLGVTTVIATYLLASEAFPDLPGAPFLAAWLVAFNPQFVFMSGVFNNDAGIAAASALILWLAVRRLGRPRSGVESALLGLFVGVGLLMKLSGVALLGLVGATLVLEAGLYRDFRRVFIQAAIVFGLAALVAGWWFARNLALYGDPLGWNALLGASASLLRAQPLGVVEAAQTLWDARGSFWGLFGWSNILLPDWFYVLTDLMTVVGLIGLGGVGWTAWKRRDAVTLARLGLMVGWFVVVAAALIRWVQLNAAADQGRLLFPAVAAVGAGIGAGLAWLADRLLKGRGAGAWPTGLAASGFAVNLAIAWAVILPAYRPTFGGAVPVGEFRPVRFGDGIELLAAQVSPGAVRAGDPVEIDLWWRAVKPVAGDWSVSLTVFDTEFNVVAGVNSWPQGGRAPTSVWPAGAVVHDRYRLLVSRTGPEPEAGTVWVALYDARDPGGSRLNVYAGDGRYLGSTVQVGRVRLKPADGGEAGPSPSQSVDYRFGAGVRLAGYDAMVTGGELKLDLYWRAEAPIRRAYNVFFHVVDGQGRIVAQDDGPPAGGRYPTDLWEPGDRLRDRHRVDLSRLPPGEYWVRVGLYSLEDGQRLPAVGPDGTRQPEDAVQVYQFRVP